MPDYDLQVKLFKALMHPVRLAILDILQEGEQCVCHMEAILGLRQAYISQHLMILREAGLVQDRRDGWNIFYRVSEGRIYAVIHAARQITGAGSEATALLSKARQAHMSCDCPKCRHESDSVLVNETGKLEAA